MSGRGANASQSAPKLAVLLISAAALGYEILLLRLFAIIQWHHLAAMIISLALLGYGASGTMLSIAGGRLVSRFPRVFFGCAVLFGLTAVGCFQLVQHLPFNALELLWTPRQWLYLFFAYVLLGVPFFFGASCIALAFMRFGERIPSLYAYDLLGAGLGAIGILFSLFHFSPEQVLVGLGLLGIGAGVVGVAETRSSGAAWQLSLAGIAAGLLVALPQDWTQLKPSEFKPLEQALRVQGTEVLAQRDSPLARLTLIRSPEVPLRYAPGLSLYAPQGPPAGQLGLFFDGDGLTSIGPFGAGRDPGRVGYLDWVSSALPYHMVSPRRVLILGSGGGDTVRQAFAAGAAEVDAVELDGGVIELIEQKVDRYAGSPAWDGRIRWVVADARGFLDRTERHYDLIQIALVDAGSSASAGVQGVTESYLYTVQAFRAMLDRLTPSGMIAITRWVQLPPRDEMKLFGTVVEALRSDRVSDPGSHLAWLRGWATSTLVVSRWALTADQILGLQRFAEQRGFDLAWYPGITEENVNRFNRLPEPYYFRGARAWLGDSAEDYVAHYKYDIRPSTDDRPYFFNGFRWSTFPEMLQLRERGGMGLLDVGYPMLVATLAQALVAGTLLILLPLRLGRRPQACVPVGAKLLTLIYFLAIGLAYLMLEIALIQKLQLLVGHPLYAVAAVLSGLLISSGVGSALAGRWQHRLRARGILLPVAVLSLIAFGYLGVLPELTVGFASAPSTVRLGIAVLLVVPLGLCMGMPFPLGLARLSAQHPSLVPWAWGINGCASLVSAVMAALLAVHWGFSGVFSLALGLYWVAVLAWWPLRSKVPVTLQ